MAKPATPREIKTDAGTPTGHTVGLVDAVETILRSIACRNLQPPEVQEALRSFVLSDDLRTVVEAAGARIRFERPGLER